MVANMRRVDMLIWGKAGAVGLSPDISERYKTVVRLQKVLSTLHQVQHQLSQTANQIQDGKCPRAFRRVY
jgi:hypothetical protein